MKPLFGILGCLLLLSGCESTEQTVSFPEGDEQLLEELTCLIDSVNTALKEQDSATYEQLMDEWFR